MGEGKRENIINAAVGLFAEKGFEGTSIRDISAKADVNVAMIKGYGSKNKIAWLANRRWFAFWRVVITGWSHTEGSPWSELSKRICHVVKTSICRFRLLPVRGCDQILEMLFEDCSIDR